MKARFSYTGFRDTLNKTTLPPALTERISANGTFPALYSAHCAKHHLADGALEFINHIVKSLELSGGLA